jgi:hypothetical protein
LQLINHHPFDSFPLFSVAVTPGLDLVEIQSQFFWLNNGTLNGSASGHINTALPPHQPIIPGMSLKPFHHPWKGNFFRKWNCFWPLQVCNCTQPKVPRRYH